MKRIIIIHFSHLQKPHKSHLPHPLIYFIKLKGPINGEAKLNPRIIKPLSK